MAGNPKVKLGADTAQFTRAMRDAAKNLGIFGKSANDLQKKLIGALSVGSIVAFGKATLDAYQDQEKANKALMEAVGGSKEAYAELTRQAEQLRSATGIDDGAIMQIQQLAAGAGYSTEKIKKLTEASVQLSAKTGDDLQASYMKLNKTLSGSVGRLATIDPAFAELSKTQLKNGAAIDLVLTKYEGFAQSTAKETTKLASNFDELKEAIGYALSGSVFDPFLGAVNSAIKSLTDLISVPLSEKMEQERERVNALTTALMDAKMPMEVRKQLYSELVSIAPDVVKGIDAENISTVTLTKNLAEYNKQQLNKIILQRGSEKYEKALNKQADAFESLSEAQTTAASEGRKLYENIVSGSNALKKQKAIDIQAQYIAGSISVAEYTQKLAKLAEVSGNVSVTTGTQFSYIAGQTSDAQKAVNALVLSEMAYEEAVKETNKALKDRADFAAKAGLSLTAPEISTGSGGGGGGGDETKTPKGLTDMQKAEGESLQARAKARNIFTKTEYKAWDEFYKKVTDLGEQAGQINIQQGQATLEAENQRIQEYLDAYNKAQQEYLNSTKSKYDQELEMLQELLRKKLISEEEYAKLKKKLDTKTYSELAGLVGNAFGQIAGMFDEQTTAYKAFASAQALINTFLGATAAYTAAMELGPAGIALAPILAAVAVAAGLAQVAQINGVQMATGGIVPSGFPNDTYPALLSSGETVIPAPKPLGGMMDEVVVYGRLYAGDIYLSNQRGSRIMQRRG